MSRTTNSPSPSAAGRVAAALLLVVAAFQAALAAGAPLGEAAFGGASPGVLPDTRRVSSAIAAVAYLLLAAVAGTRWAGPAVRRRVLTGAAVVMVVGSIVNLASPSFVERMIWTPVTVALVVALWHAARHGSLSRASRSSVAFGSGQA
jgi:hypothetical protein